MGGSEEVGQQVPVEGFIELPDRDVLVDDPERIDQYRAISLAGGLQVGSEAEVLGAWQWLANHSEVTNSLEEWFARRVAELREMGRIK